MKSTLIIVSFILVLSLLVNIAFISDRLKNLNENGRDTSSKIEIDTERDLDCSICQLLAKDLNSYWNSLNGLSEFQISNFVMNYASTVPEPLLPRTKDFLDRYSDRIIKLAGKGKAPFNFISDSLNICQ